MTENATQLWPEILAVIAGSVVLFLFAIALAWPHRPRVSPGNKGHRQKENSVSTKRFDRMDISIALPVKLKKPAAGCQPLSNWRYRGLFGG